MPTPHTDDLVERLRALSESATPGPWRAWPHLDRRNNAVPNRYMGVFEPVPGQKHGSKSLVINACAEGLVDDAWIGMRDADMALIIELRNNLDTILSALSARPAVDEGMIERLEPIARQLVAAMGLDPDEPVPPHGEWPRWYGACGPLEAALSAPPSGRGEERALRLARPEEGSVCAGASDQLGVGDVMKIAARGFDAWAAKPHNAKWARKIDGTPIRNDLIVNIAQAFADAELTPAPPEAPAEGGERG
jgi:hypothetical protein